MANFVIHFKSWVADGVASEVNNFNMHVSKPETHLPIYQILFSADGEKTAEEEDEDLNGTGQLKKDVGFLFSGLEQEFEESKSARAKLRERIKKVKTAIKEADDAEATENGETITKESEEEKDKRRAELREKFRLQREAKKKAKAEAGQ